MTHILKKIIQKKLCHSIAHRLNWKPKFLNQQLLCYSIIYLTRDASSLPKKLSLLSKYSVAIYYTKFLQNIRNTPKFKFKFSKSVL